jgi:hypothetical protein
MFLVSYELYFHILFRKMSACKNFDQAWCESLILELFSLDISDNITRLLVSCLKKEERIPGTLQIPPCKISYLVPLKYLFLALSFSDIPDSQDTKLGLLADHPALVDRDD